MNTIMKTIYSLCFGFCAIPVVAIVIFGIFGVEPGPDNGPIVMIIAILLALALASWTFSWIHKVFSLFGVEGDFTATARGRFFVVANAIWIIAVIWYFNSEFGGSYSSSFNWNFVPVLCITPVIAALIALVAKWVVGGRASRVPS